VTLAPRSTLRIVTYNIHRSRGMDRRTRPTRVAEVLHSIDADVVALQEVLGAGPDGSSHIEEIGASLGMGWVMASTRQLRGHQFGNVVLSRFPITHHAHHDLSWKSCEERCMQRVDVDVNGRTLHVYNVHLGTAILERRHQARPSFRQVPPANANEDRERESQEIASVRIEAWHTLTNLQRRCARMREGHARCVSRQSGLRRGCGLPRHPGCPRG